MEDTFKMEWLQEVDNQNQNRLEVKRREHILYKISYEQSRCGYKMFNVESKDINDFENVFDTIFAFKELYYVKDNLSDVPDFILKELKKKLLI